MGAAEVISFEEVRARKQWSTLRQQLHERFDQWLDTLEQAWHELPATLSEVTATVWDLRQPLTGGITETIVAHTHVGERQRQQASCPRCARVLKVQEQVGRTVETMVGPVELERPYFYCRACRVGLYPLDDVLGLVAGCKQLDMQHAAAKLVTEVPYDTAHSLFDDLTGMHFGSERLHTVTNQVAEGLTVLDVAPSRQEIERRIASVAAGRFRRPVLVLGIDGAYVPTRPESAREPGEGRRGTRARRARWRGQWRDAKGFRFYLLDGERIVHVLSWHQVQNKALVAGAIRWAVGGLESSNKLICQLQLGSTFGTRVTPCSVQPTGRTLGTGSRGIQYRPTDRTHWRPGHVVGRASPQTVRPTRSVCKPRAPKTLAMSTSFGPSTAWVKGSCPGPQNPGPYPAKPPLLMCTTVTPSFSRSRTSRLPSM